MLSRVLFTGHRKKAIRMLVIGAAPTSVKDPKVKILSEEASKGCSSGIPSPSRTMETGSCLDCIRRDQDPVVHQVTTYFVAKLYPQRGKVLGGKKRKVRLKGEELFMLGS